MAFHGRYVRGKPKSQAKNKQRTVKDMGRPANPKDAPKIKRYQCLFVLYPESQQAAIEYVQANFPCAWALHDKDTYTQGEFERYTSKHEIN